MRVRVHDGSGEGEFHENFTPAQLAKVTPGQFVDIRTTGMGLVWGGGGVGLGWGRASPSNRVRLNREVQQTDWQMLFMLKSTLCFVNSFPVPKSTSAKSEGDCHPISLHLSLPRLI